MQLNDFLTKRSISMARFADMVGTTTATISRIADGTVMPRRALMQRIFEATGGAVTPNDLVRLHGPAHLYDRIPNPPEEDHS